MKKVILIFWLSLAFGFCFAPINRGMVPPDQIQKELSEQQRAAQQRNLPQIGNVGSSGSTSDLSVGGPTANDPEAASAVSGALKNVEGGPKLDAEASKSLAVAGANVRASSGGSSLILWAVVLGVVGFALVFGARKWADSAIPDPTVARKKTSW